MNKLRCDGVLFDLDGVLVSSMVSVERAWRGWAPRHGLDPAEIVEASHGRRTVETIRMVAPWLDAETEARKLERQEVEEAANLSPVPGAPEFLESLPSARWTIVTSGSRELATARLEGTGLPIPRKFITADDVENGKPAPECYLAGAKALGARPETCVVFEDAVSGIAAARAAGMKVVALNTTHPKSQLSSADHIIRDLRDARVANHAPDRPETLTLMLDAASRFW